MADHDTIHATTVAIDGRGVMILGPSGAGKSDLALRLIDRGAALVADDYTVVTRHEDRLIASAPPTIRGRIEVRGLGIVPIPHRDDIAVDLAIRLQHDVERMPVRTSERFCGVAVRTMCLDPRPASAPLLAEHALRHDLP